MPVGTKATVKALHPDEVRAIGAQRDPRQHLPPALPSGRGRDRGARRAARVLRAGTGRSSPTRAVSRSSRSATRCSSVDDDGVTFRSVYDGAAERFTPESVAEIQRRLGSDIAMCLDICPPAESPRPCSSTRCSARGSGPSGRSTHPVRRASCASASRRAAPTPSCGAARSRRSSRSGSTATHSAAWRWARAASEMLETVGWAAPLLPSGKPRYFMGLGDTEGILGVIAAGIDMFDCVLPTRTARTGSALTATGRINLHNARYSRDPRPLEDDCRCPACSVSRARSPASRQPGRNARVAPALTA